MWAWQAQGEEERGSEEGTRGLALRLGVSEATPNRWAPGKKGGFGGHAALAGV